jgi:hypothetical protein
MSGTSEYASTWYQLWLDSAGTRLMVPDLTGTADSDSTNQLVDSTADFVTDKVAVGDIVYNTTDLTQGTVTAVVDLYTLTLSGDIFPDGNENYKIRILTPTGIGKYNSRIGAAYNNGSSHLDDSTYTQIQEAKRYSQAAGDLTITASNWTTAGSEFSVEQVNDWTGEGKWKLFGNFLGNLSASAANYTITISGITSAAYVQYIGAWTNQVTDDNYARIAASSGVITHNSNNTGASPQNYYEVDIFLSKKPTFHT